MDRMNRTLLKNLLDKIPSIDYPSTSRIHPLRSFPPNTYVKREDELGFGISGIKIRKYRTLIPSLILSGCKEVLLSGGPFSNHLLSLSQLLIENGIRPILFLKGPKPKTIQGNFLFLKMLGSEIHWIEKKEWPRINSILSDYLANSPHAKIIPEGGSLFPSFLGALTLPLDILRNEEEHSLYFDSIFLDAGTGWSAAALLLSFALLEKQTHIHLLLVADDEAKFFIQLKNLHEQFEHWLGARCPMPTRFTCHRPTLAASFGSTNQTLFQTIVETAKLEGFFLDPIYSAKLFYEARSLINSHQTTLLIHSGGALTLSGFQEQIGNVLKSCVEI